MKLSDFDFDLPPELIADRPVSPRDAARLLEVRPEDGTEIIRDYQIRDLPGLLEPGDVMVFNDTKVIPVRLAGRRGYARVEVTLHRRTGDARWRAFARPAKKLRPGDRIDFAPGLAAEVAEKGGGGEVALHFQCGGSKLMALIDRHGSMPLPPYIRRPRGPDARDREDYQTIFAAREGAVAAPTAGLHFTERLLADLDARGLRRVTVTLHVGAGTFLPVKTESIEEHVMHAEWGEVGEEAADVVNGARAAGGRVVAVGTTSLRLIETATEDGVLRPFTGETGIFITPGYRFRIADLLVTNFHLPRSTLFMLVASFCGRERMLRAYQHAKAAGYRFYSYGDACLLHRAEEA